MDHSSIHLPQVEQDHCVIQQRRHLQLKSEQRRLHLLSLIDDRAKQDWPESQFVATQVDHYHRGMVVVVRVLILPTLQSPFVQRVTQ